MIKKQASSLTGTVYDDGTVRFLWDGTNKQPQFRVLVLPASSWFDGGIKLATAPGAVQTWLTNVDDIQFTAGVDYYFTNSGTPINTAFNMISYGNYAETWLIAESDATYPTYFVKWVMGDSFNALTVVVERY